MKPKLLFLAHLLPWPLDGGGQIKSYYTLKALAEAYEVTVLAFARPSDRPWEPEFAVVRTVPLERSRLKDAATAARCLISGASWIVTRDGVPAMRQAVESALASGEYAALHVDHLQMAQFVPPDTGRTKVILDQHNVEHRIPQRLAETNRGPMGLYARGEWRRLRRFEAAAVRRADLTLAVSDEDRAALCELAPSARIETVPIGVDLDYFAPVERLAGSTNLLSIGTMYWPPNVDAALHFCERILPEVRRCRPDARVTIVGARPTAAVQALAADPGVVVTGSVPDVRPYAADCAAFIVPLRSGSGMRVKILTALAMGLPVVSTTVGAEGIEVEDGVHLLLADGPDAFAAATVRLLDDPELGARLGAAGRARMVERYGWDAVGARLRAVYGGLA